MNETLKNQPEELSPGESDPAESQPSAPQENPASQPPHVQSFTPHKSEEKMRIEMLEREVEKAKDQTLRAMAETENMRKRAAREREDASKFAVTGFARDLLSVADNLRRAIEAITGQTDQADPRMKTLLSGIEATERELLSVFERNGIKKLEPLHQPFNPNHHEVIFEAPVEGLPPGIIFQLVQPGYLLHDRLLRPARVGVVKENTGGQKPDDLPPEPGQNIDTQV
ncbi:MAG: nucleotide exchange factor GrpE [Alphaproteobacteria bacterium]|nr:nucleotide exchange factor GrpE [Alphaproteobacteria bacterium]QQS56762.1 MAG: nucleotide exchange factor GrpE [Alphaproteobacteria bacterium]